MTSSGMLNKQNTNSKSGSKSGSGGESTTNKPKYQQPVSQQVSLENSEYLFPDLPPPPDALLDNTTSASPPSLQQNSRWGSKKELIKIFKMITE